MSESNANSRISRNFLFRHIFPQGSLVASVVVGVTALILFAACSLQAPVTSTQDVSAEYTRAALTIIAGLTQAAPQLTSTQTASQLTPTQPLPESTATSQVPTPTVQSPTGTMTPVPPSPTTTETAAPTPTLSSTDPRASLGNPNYEDTFKDGANWPLYTDAHVSFEVSSGTLTMIALKADRWDGWMLTWPNISNFYLEMNATTKQCSGADRYGIMFRAGKAGQSYAGYQFIVACNGRFFLRKWDGEKYSLLIDWTANDAIKKGAKQTNRIGVMADGKRISLYANGVLLGDIKDSSYSEGLFGVLVGAAETPGFIVNVAEIAYWDLK